MSGCWFPHALHLIATQQLDLETEPLEVLLLGEDSTILAELAAQTLGDFATLGEFDGSGYARVTPTTPLWTEAAGVGTDFTVDDVPFGNLGTGSERLTWTLFATIAGNIPLFFFGRALGPTNPAGADVNITSVSVALPGGQA